MYWDPPIDTRGHPTGARRSNDLLALTPNRYLVLLDKLG
jgi:hypothetical protein